MTKRLVRQGSKVALKHISIVGKKDVSETFTILFEQIEPLSVEEKQRFAIGVYLGTCGGLLELVQIWVEKELNVESSLAVCPIKKTVQKWLSQHEVVQFKRRLEVFTLDESLVQLELVDILAINQLVGHVWVLPYSFVLVCQVIVY